MLAPSRARVLTWALGPSPSPSATLPGFLVPAFQTTQQQNQQERTFSSTPSARSKLGRTPISVPPGVELTITAPKAKIDRTTYLRVPTRMVEVAGPLGKLNLELPHFMNIAYDTESRMVSLSVEDQEIKKQKEMWGTKWAYLNRYVRGVSEGHTTVLRLVGIGYRATVEERPTEEQYPGQQFVVLKLGFSHPVVMPVPEGIKASAPQVTRILLEGIDKEVMHEFAAKIRRWRVPEPYKGKGIFVNNETIKLKQKKIK